MSDSDPERRRHLLVHARCALAIVHAQYWRALTLAEGADMRERAAALAEARRLLTVAVGLHGRGDARPNRGPAAAIPRAAMAGRYSGRPAVVYLINC